MRTLASGTSRATSPTLDKNSVLMLEPSRRNALQEETGEKPTTSQAEGVRNKGKRQASVGVGLVYCRRTLSLDRHRPKVGTGAGTVPDGTLLVIPRGGPANEGRIELPCVQLQSNNRLGEYNDLAGGHNGAHRTTDIRGATTEKVKSTWEKHSKTQNRETSRRRD